MVEVIGVSKAFGGQPVLDGVDLAIEEGSTFVLFGVSGSGKTVLLKIIAGLLSPDRGTVRVDGEDITRLSHEELAHVWRKVGIAFQAGALFDSLTVYENLELPIHERLHLSGAETSHRIHETLELLGLDDAALQRPSELSGGMRKRVAFARALVLRPKLLLFDEPTQGLDPLTNHLVGDEILDARRTLGCTIFAITHDLPTGFRIADRIGLLDEGKLIGNQPPHEFEQNPHPAVRRFLHTWIAQHHAGAPA